MQKKEQEQIAWLEFDLLADIPRVKHGVFLRHGGVSQGAFASLNMGENVGDDPQHVLQNRQQVADILHAKRLSSLQQCHGKAIHEVMPSASCPQADAITTSMAGVGLMINHADCQAVILYDPVHHAAANVHAGWRGSVQNILAESIHFMQQRYGTQPADLLACISPSLGPQDAQFIHYRTELPESFWQYQVKPDYFDFWQISTQQLLELGVLSHHIEVAGISTYSNTADFFSYRKERTTGRNATIIVLQ